MYTVRKILVPTDFSEQAGVAFRLACSMARQHNADVVVLHVIPPPVTWGEAVARLPPDGYEEQLWKDYLTPMRSPEPGVRVEPRLEEGDPARTIVAVAEEIGCDLIVMGTHGRSGLGRVFMGSVAERVLRKAPCPVLTSRRPFPGDVPTGKPTSAQQPAPKEAPPPACPAGAPTP